jgi:hypothetical protein
MAKQPIFAAYHDQFTSNDFANAPKPNSVLALQMARLPIILPAMRKAYSNLTATAMVLPTVQV